MPCLLQIPRPWVPLVNWSQYLQSSHVPCLAPIQSLSISGPSWPKQGLPTVKLRTNCQRRSSSVWMLSGMSPQPPLQCLPLYFFAHSFSVCSHCQCGKENRHGIKPSQSTVGTHRTPSKSKRPPHAGGSQAQAQAHSCGIPKVNTQTFEEIESEDPIDFLRS